ncbi:DUF975 family protein [Leuconostocaceae bacterium ESL0723]|nr:DUF975 family protein [Leuconostocaceae bacterium ESL0723]
MDRYELKRSVKDKFHGNWGYVILVALPLAIMAIVDLGNTFVRGAANQAANANSGHVDFTTTLSAYAGNSGSSWVINLIVLFVTAGVTWSLLDFVRTGRKNHSPFLSFITAFKPKGLFWGTLVIGVLRALLIFIGLIFLIVPGIILALGYSQALFIYRDKLAQGEKIGYYEALALSQQMMKGHKWEYFVLYWSFIGWAFLSFITAGIGYIWLVPYEQATYAAYYDQLAQQQSLEESDVNFG